MKILVVLVLLYCGCLADRERIDSHYADLLSDELIQKIQKRLQHWEEDDDSGSQNIASSGVGDAVTRSGKLSCHFSMQENTIIRTKDSLDAGATYQNAPVVSSREECRRECCKLGTKCNLAVYKHKQGDDACYLFDCGTPNVCNFSSHAGYVSMHVIRWMDDQQQPVDQHEDALAQLATTTTAVPVVSSQAHALQSEAQTPYNLHVVETTSNSIKLGWEGKESVYSLHIFQSGGAEDTYVSRKNEHEVDNLTPHTNYTLYVISYNNNGASSPSAQIVVTTGDDVPTSYPQTIVAPGRSSLNVTWTDLPASEAQGIVTQYKIVYRKHGTQTKKEVTIPGSANEFVISGLERGQSYDVRVEAGTRAGFANLPDGGWLTATVLPESQGKPCSKFQFACTSGSPRCIAIYDACDGMDHCSDGSDEKNCGDDDTNGGQLNGQQSDGQGASQGGGQWNNNYPYVQGQQGTYQGQDYPQSNQVKQQQTYDQTGEDYSQLDHLSQQVGGGYSRGGQMASSSSKNVGQAGRQGGQRELGRPLNRIANNQRPSYPQQPYMAPKQPNQWPSQSQSNAALGQLQQVQQQQQQPVGQITDKNVLPSRVNSVAQAGQIPQQSVSPQRVSPQTGYSSPVRQQQMPVPRRKPVQQFPQAQIPSQKQQSQQVQQSYQNIPRNNFNPNSPQRNFQPQLPKQVPNNPQNNMYNKQKSNKPKVAQMPPQPASVLQKMQSTSSAHMGRDGIPVSELHDHSSTVDQKQSGSLNPLRPPVSNTKVPANPSGGKISKSSAKSNAPSEEQDSKTQINYSDGGTIYTHRKEGPKVSLPKASVAPSGIYKQLDTRPQNPYLNTDRSSDLSSYRKNLYPYGYNRGQARGQGNRGQEDSYLSPTYPRQKTYTYPQYDNTLYNYIVPNTNDFDYDYNNLEAGT